MRDRPLDVICIGRASIDLYGEQVGTRLEDTRSFAKYVGGSAANVAIGTARLGLRSALVTGVGDEQMGRFIIEQLAAEGVDTSHVVVDAARMTALVVLGLRDGHTFPHIFFRTDCADMAIGPEHVDKAFVARAAAVHLTGTHLSKPGVEAASRAAVAHAKAAGARVSLDIDYRPVLWGLARHAAGESRFVASAEVTRHLQSVLPDCDLVVGTEDEIHIAGGSTDTLAAVAAMRAVTEAVIVVKRGPLGCVAFPGAIPDTIEKGIVAPGNPVEVFNTLGAGDGFMSGFLRGWLRDEPIERCCAIANAAGALVVSRHGCAPAIPSWEELAYYLSHGSPTPRLRDDARLTHLHRVTTRRRRWPEVMALAFDHRRQLEDAADRVGAPRGRLARLKGLIADGALKAGDGAAGLGAIVDDRYGGDVLPRLTGIGWWVARPVETPGVVPLAFEAGANVGLSVHAWPEEHAAKCLVAYHPDDPEPLRAIQEERLLDLYRACVLTNHDLMVEVIPPESGRPADAGTISRALARFYDRGILPDWWKLPAPAGDDEWRALGAVIAERDPHCRGVLLLGLNAPVEALERSFRAAARHSLCKGFAVGRSIFQQPSEDWLAGRIGDAQVVARVADAYRAVIEAWRRHRP